MSADAHANAVEREWYGTADQAQRQASKPVGAYVDSGRHDPGVRRKATRHGRQRGAWVYIPGETLHAAGFDPHGEPPYYRTHGFKRSRNASSVIVSLYRER